MTLSGSVVEIILNRDSRLTQQSKLRKVNGWATLNNPNLELAQAAGLPVEILLDSGESVSDARPIRFVRIRNKIAHGDLSDLPSGISDYLSDYEVEARDQLKKADKFLIDWFNSSPDIQSLEIQK